MRQQQAYTLPALQPAADTLARHFCSQFMHEFQRQPAQDSWYRILTAIETTAKKTGNAPEVVARALVENGLRASKESFPEKFVSAVEDGLAMPRWNIGAVTPQQRELTQFWGVSPAIGYKKASRRYH